jgi:Immunoglobulin I-set domain/Immunoglobulin domain
MICREASAKTRVKRFLFTLMCGSLGVVSGIRCSNPTGPLMAPVITTQPQPAEQTVAAEATLTFTVAVTGNPAPTYQWKKDGVDCTQSTATSATLKIAHAAISDTGAYAVVVTNRLGTVTSDSVRLVVTQAPVITVQPFPQTVTAGDSAAFTVAVTCNPLPTYQWKYSPDGTTWTSIGGATNASYTIGSVASGNAGYYEVVVTNFVGLATSNSVTLTVD